MKKTTLTILLTAMITVITFGQITKMKDALVNETVDNTPYDSLDNSLGKNVRKYIGQELYLKGFELDIERKNGYYGFVTDYTKEIFMYSSKSSKKANIYKCCADMTMLNASKYEELNGKYFKVLNVINHPKAKENESLYGNTFYLKLQEKESKDIVYYEYDTRFVFKFIVVGYFEKTKRRHIGTEYVLRGLNWIDTKTEMYDIQNGKPVSFSAGTIWKCVDFTINEKNYELSLIIESSKGERLAISMDRYRYYTFTKIDADNYKQKFGEENWTLILNKKLKIGMTKEMCELSCGKPKEINQTTTESNKAEQWVYYDNYLYFDNGVLTSMQYSMK